MQFRNAQGFWVAAWEHRLVLRAPSFRYGERHQPVRRPSITVVLALGRPFRVCLNEAAQPQATRGLIIGPNVLRDWIEAENADLWAFDVTAGCPEFADLLSVIGAGEVRELDDAPCEALAALCRAHSEAAGAADLLAAVVAVFCPQRNNVPVHDARLAAVLKLVESRPLDECSAAGLAQEVGLSVSRMRALFARELHCPLSYYLRMAALWKALPLIERGQSFTEAAHAVGFHDLSHFHRAVTEFIGYSPTASQALYATAAMSLDGRTPAK